MQLRNTAGKVSCYEEIQLLTFKVIISAFFNDGKLRRKINIVIYSLKSLNVKKIPGLYIYSYCRRKGFLYKGSYL